MKRILSRLCYFFGCILIAIAIYRTWQHENPNRLQFNVANTELNQFEKQKNNGPAVPVGLSIQDIGIYSAIISAQKSGSNWETTDSGISYLSSSSIPGEIGNSILYGHNWKSILGNLYKARPGQRIEIVYSNNEKRSFIINTIQVVSPDQASVLKNTNDKRITLYTCTGFLDQKRLVVVAMLEESLAKK